MCMRGYVCVYVCVYVRVCVCVCVYYSMMMIAPVVIVCIGCVNTKCLLQKVARHVNFFAEVISFVNF